MDAQKFISGKMPVPPLGRPASSLTLRLTRTWLGSSSELPLINKSSSVAELCRAMSSWRLGELELGGVAVWGATTDHRTTTTDVGTTGLTVRTHLEVRSR